MAYRRIAQTSEVASADGLRPATGDERLSTHRRAAAVAKWLLQGKRLRAKTCAQQLGVSQRTFYTMMEAASLELPIINVKGDWFISLESRIEMGVAQKQAGGEWIG